MSQFTRQIHWQHGFLKGRSAATQLILTHHQWAKALDEGHQVHVIYQTRETVFHRDIQTPRRELKIRRAAEYF